jgi:hypothetical protein
VCSIGKILVGKLEGSDQLEDLGVDGKIILEWILTKIVWEGVVWILLAQGRDHSQAVANTVMNSRVSQKTGNFLSS